MALYFQTSNPSALLKAFDARIDQTEPKGKIDTWKRFTQDGKSYYTHTSTQWKDKAFFTPVVNQGILRFNIIKNKDFNVSIVAYGYYHGHLTETFLNHFDTMFTEAISSATPRDGDYIAKAA